MSETTSTNLLDQLRCRVQALSEQATEERDELRTERDQLLEAFLHLFPYDIYRDKRPDLAGMTDRERALHFARYGLKEGVALSFPSVIKEIRNKTRITTRESSFFHYLEQDIKEIQKTGPVEVYEALAFFRLSLITEDTKITCSESEIDDKIMCQLLLVLEAKANAYLTKAQSPKFIALIISGTIRLIQE